MLQLLAVGTRLTHPAEEEKRINLLALLAKISDTSHGLFKELVMKHKKILVQVLKLTPAEAAVFQHAARLTRYTRRKLATGFIKVWGFNPLPSEKVSAAFEAEVSKSFTSSSLDRGKMLLIKKGKDSTPSNCYYARVLDLPTFIGHEVEDALREVHEDPDSMRNLRCPRYNGRLRITFGGDKGGETTKITASLGGGREPFVLGMFHGPDNARNLELFMGNWTVQLRKLHRDGITIQDPLTGEELHFPVDILTNGDMSFIGELLGHSGSSAFLPSLYRMVTRHHLQKDHRYKEAITNCDTITANSNFSYMNFLFPIFAITNKMVSCRNGEPHIPGRPECQAAWRTPDAMEEAYLANKLKNTTAEAMAAKAKRFQSIKGPCLAPITDILDVVPAGLHISLMVGLALVRLLESWCEILDSEEDESKLADLVEDIFYTDEGNELEEEEGDNGLAGAAGVEVQVEQGDGEGQEQAGAAGVGGDVVSEEIVEEGQEQATGVEGDGQEHEDMRRQHREEKSRAQKELTQAEQVVREREVEVARLAKTLGERRQLQQRIVLNNADQGYLAVDEMVMNTTKVKTKLKRFKYCSDLCLLTPYDRRVSLQLCDVCEHSCHEYCELWQFGLMKGVASPQPEDQEELPEQEEVLEHQVCFSCRPPDQTFQSYDHLEQLVVPLVDEARNKLSLAEVGLAEARAEESRCRAVLSSWVGSRRKELNRLLEEVLQVVRQAYQGGTIVGNHVQKILEHHEKLSVVLAERPEIQELFNTFCGHYHAVHRLMKAARWLTSTEIATLESSCTTIGRLWPQVFKGSTIPPKVDVLVFVVPAFAKRWGTLGGHGEERIEALHQVYNRFGRTFASMRHKGEAAAKAMKNQRVLQESQKIAGRLLEPTPRVFKNPAAREEKFGRKRRRRGE